MRKKIVMSLGLLLLLILIIGGTSLIMLTQVRKASAELDTANTMTTEVNNIEMQHYRWLQGLTLTVYDGAEFTGSLDSTACSLGKWLTSATVQAQTDPAFLALTDSLQAPHEAIHAAAGNIVSELETGNQEAAEVIFHSEVLPSLEKTIAALDEINVYAEGVMAQKQARCDFLFLLAIWLIAGIAVLSVAGGSALILLMIKQVVPPLQQLTAAANGLAKGNVDISVPPASKDELGELATAFRGMADGIREQALVMGKIAEGDYTVSVPVRGEEDLMNRAINQMLESSNSAMAQIRLTADGVAAGAMQISSGSQLLASGSSQQSATLQELSAAIAEIQSQAVSNSKLATGTVADVNEAGRLMGESLGYMDEMTGAMRAIDESSNNIAKVIKVIDDIAFQTNILALNAAVEAARAGQHGKGFAVVADEVRSLAAKSAEAAQETAALIERSVESVARGNAVAAKTGISLGKVGEIAAGNAEAMGKMSESSVRQTEAIREVTEGVEEIAKVVHANSANAEESAASAEELNAQSDLLAQVVSHFHLREGAGTPALPTHKILGKEAGPIYLSDSAAM